MKNKFDISKQLADIEKAEEDAIFMQRLIELGWTPPGVHPRYENEKDRTTKPKDRFDLEQEIMGCWQICDDLDAVAGSITDEDTKNLLLGVKRLYQIRFDKLFNTFEDCISKNEFTRNSE